MTPQRNIPRLLFLMAFLLGYTAHVAAEKITAIVWDVEARTSTNAPPPPASNVLAQVISVLKKQAPDFILLQNVSDWATCDSIVKALKPAEYHVLVCSAFAASKQCAVLGRSKAHFTWSETWNKGGFAVANAQVKGKRVAFFSVLQANPQGATRILDEFARMKSWAQNKPDAALVAGSFTPQDVTNKLMEAFSPAPWKSNAPPRMRLIALGHPMGSASQARPLPAGLTRSAPVAFEFELDPATVAENLAQEEQRAKAREAARLAAETEAALASAATNQPATNQITASQSTNASLSTAAPAQPTNAAAAPSVKEAPPAAPATNSAPTNPPAQLPTNNPTKPAQADATKSQVLLWSVIGGSTSLVLFGVLAAAFKLLRGHHRRVMGLLTTGEQAHYVVVSPRSATGSDSTTMPDVPLVQVDQVDQQTHSEALPASPAAQTDGRHEAKRALVPHLVAFLKERFVQKLLRDRTTMIESQEAAALKALQVDERLGRIERQIQEQNRMYEQRISELTLELSTARHENRELIRARIMQVKAEMEAARERLMAEAKGG